VHTAYSRQQTADSRQQAEEAEEAGEAEESVTYAASLTLPIKGGLKVAVRAL
jgi:hypothetical protein